MLCYAYMEINKNIYNNLKNTDDYNSQNQRLRDVEWYNYNNNVKKIKIRLLELEKIKNLKVSVSNEPIIEITSEIEDNNNMSSSNTSNIKMIEKQNEEKIQNNINNNNIDKKIIDDIFNNAEVESIKDNKKSNIDNKNNNILENQNILNNKSDKKKEKKEEQDNSEPEEEIKVLPSQVKNPLEWLFTENYFFNKPMGDIHYKLTSYVVGTVFGSWFGLFLASTTLFPTFGMIIAIYAVMPKGIVMGVSQFFSRILGINLPLSNDYKNLTTYMIQYAKDAPNKVKDKVASREAYLKNRIAMEKKDKEFIEKRKKELQKYIDNVLPEIDKKDNIKPNLIKLKDNKKEEQKQNIINNNSKSTKVNPNNIDDVKKLIDMIKQEKEKNKNKEKELWLNKIDNQVKSDISRSLLLEKPQNNN